MKKTFPGHFPPTGKQLDRLWESCVFALDANILLNLYRYSDGTRDEFIRVLRAIKERLWLPHRAAQEYFNNRLTVISQQEKAYDEAITTIRALEGELSNARQHPFLSDKLMGKLTGVLEEVVSELTSTKATHANRTSSDEIQKAVGDLFNGRVGPPYSEEELEVMCREGEGRYERKVPPGYKDDGKYEGTPSVASMYRKYGNLIVWRQILDCAREVKKGVILVNDDKKEDWWLIFRGKTLGPRPELVEEFLRDTGLGFHMYQADRFLELAAALLKQEVAPESVVEIRDLRKRDLALVAELEKRRIEEMMLRARAGESKVRSIELRSRLNYLRKRLDQLQYRLISYHDELHKSGAEDREGFERSPALSAQAASVEKDMEEVREEIKALEYQLKMARDELTRLEGTNDLRSGGSQG